MKFFLFLVAVFLVYLFCRWYYRKKAERVEAERWRINSDLVHDLKLPLTVIVGFVELLKSTNFSEESRFEYLDLIDYEINRMQRMISEILAGKKNIKSDEKTYSLLTKLRGILSLGDFDRFSGKDLLVSGAQTNCTENLKTICKSFVISLEHRNISLETDIQDNLFASIDGNQFWRAVSNILENAIKYNSEGGKIKLSAYAEGKFVIVSVADTGVGISPKNTSKVFMRGFREDKSEAKGFGLGLASVREILTSNGGKIKLESEPGKGSNFTIYLRKIIKSDKS
ncbi:MAG: HAMP domain-containing histidine kinase [Oscillospiraceae bacterium]|jgi:two-component system phosphate regulon sensor histidine kinase PhoR|nr:HAMP domain-containing histidine kinase [Oscillospiraceae bacterium]